MLERVSTSALGHKRTWSAVGSPSCLARRRAQDFIEVAKLLTLACGRVNRPLPNRGHSTSPQYCKRCDIFRVRRGVNHVEIEQIEASGQRSRSKLPHVSFAVMLLSQPIAKRTAPTVITIATDYRPSHQIANGLVCHCERQRLALTCPIASGFDPLCCHLMCKGNRPISDPSADIQSHHHGRCNGILGSNAAQTEPGRL